MRVDCQAGRGGRGAVIGGYQRAWLARDAVAGLTVWAVLIPEALAYATIAGVSPVVGLYAAPAALVLYALLGSSRHVVTGPMAATAALSAATVGAVAGSDAEFTELTVALALVVGALALAAGLLRLGFLANFISEPVLKGFIIGLALTIMAGQLPKLFGIDAADGNFFEKLWGFATDLGDTNGSALAIGVVSLAVVLGLRRFAPAVPGSLIAVAVGILAVTAFDLDDRGVSIVGDVPAGLPPLGLPDVGWSDYLTLAGPGVGVMLVGFAEGLGAAKTYAAKFHYDIDANRELVGLGAANLGAGLSSGMVVNGSLSKTAVNASAGARSQMSGLVVAVLTVITLLFLTGLFADLPDPTLAAIVIAALIELVDFRALADLYRASTSRLSRIYGALGARPDFLAAVAAMLGVLVFDTLPGLVIGIALSLLLLVYRASRPHVAELGEIPGAPGQYGDRSQHPERAEVAGVKIVRVESGLFFANAEAVRSQIRAAAGVPGTRAVVLDAESMPFVDVTAAKMLVELADDLDRGGVSLVMAKDIGQVRDVMRTAFGDRPALYPDVAAAVQALRAH